MQSFSPVVDTAIGLVVVYIAFSLLASWLNEQLSALFKTRGKMLVAAITQLLSGGAGSSTPAAQQFLADPIFLAMKKNAASAPQYVSAQQFSSIVLGMVNPPAPAAAAGGAPAPSAAAVLAQIQKNAATLGIGPQVSALIGKANGDYDAFVKAVEDWYDDHMDRVSGWYKQHAQLLLLVIGALLAVIWNADSLRMVRALSCNAALRASVQSIGGAAGTADKPNTAVVASVLDAVPLGWDFAGGEVGERQLSCDAIGATGPPQVVSFASPADRLRWLAMKVLGLLATALALSLGAPFWFDALSKLTRVRMAGKKPEKSSNPSLAG